MRGWDPSSGGVTAEVRNAVAVLRLDRPRVLNALTLPMLEDLGAGIRHHGTGDGARAIVLSGAGRAFSSGDDLDATRGLDRDRFARLIDAFQDVTRAIVGTRVPVIAALTGIAVGGAAEMACSCDVRVGGPRSDFLLPENGLGLTISNGSTLTLPRLLGPRGLALVLLGERIPAERARHLGLIDVFVEDPERVEEEARRIAAELGEDGRSTPLHLDMLRPDPAAVEEALRREREAALAGWDRGWPQQGIEWFARRKARR